MKACHDITSVVTGGSLGLIQERYNIPEEYVLRALLPDASTNNKGWKARYLFVSNLNWEFRVDWLIHQISSLPPFLSEVEFITVNRLEGILSLSRAIRDMT
ncbi:hypothetical protein B296_00007297 [Ensete ventricosum]|uniref:Uncharacterized protein n=1 Tax=Ensete ventricosum TaxID=4639 RepID=A0A427AQV7_ENSVE|nr:hypothetical protein B296_00007297 [Ensete ventricosum]